MTLHSATGFSSQFVSPVMSEKSLPNFRRTCSLKQHTNSRRSFLARQDQHALMRRVPLSDTQQRQASVYGLYLARPLWDHSFFTSFAFWLAQPCPCCLRPYFAFPASEFYSMMLLVQPNQKLKTLVKDALLSCCDFSSVRQFSARRELPIISK